jgi:hypothetical protein
MVFTPGTKYDLARSTWLWRISAGQMPSRSNWSMTAATTPGSTVLESWTESSLPTAGSCCGLDTVTSPGVLLQSGVQYRLVVVPPSDSNEVWSDNTIGATGTIAESHDIGNTWIAFDAGDGTLDVVGNPVVPEPSAAMLLGTALAAMLVLFRFGSRRSS